MLVKEWTAQSAGTTLDQNYPYRLTLILGDGGPDRIGMVPAPPTQIFGELKSEAGAPGQNTAPPSEKAFGSHYIVKIDSTLVPFGQPGPYFDPSYGLFYTSEFDFEIKSIWGYAAPFQGLTFKARKRTVNDALRIVFSTP